MKHSRTFNRTPISTSRWLVLTTLLITLWSGVVGQPRPRVLPVEPGQSAEATPERAPSSGREQTPLASLLNPDGTLKHRSDFSASVDTQGYRMELTPSSAPRFMPEAATAEDDHWDPRFSIAGGTYLVEALAVSGNDVYVGGQFFVMGDVVAHQIAKWNGSAWAPLGSGTNGNVYAIAVSGKDVYVGGTFTMAGGVSANRIARWDGKAWSALGSGVNSAVLSLAVKGNDLYVGGNFTTAGDVSANRIARWNGSEWAAVGSGMNGGVGALLVKGTDLYAGGAFTTAGGSTVNRIARWDGTAWSALGSGVNRTVVALAVNGGDLYVGGSFTTAGEVSAAGIARWNGSAWGVLGNLQLNFPTRGVYSIAINGTDVYVGIDSGIVDGVSVSGVARWNGSAWTSLGTGVSSGFALATSGRDLYVGGGFGYAGGVSAHYIARWNGSEWFALGGGWGSVDGISTITLKGKEYYLGGGGNRVAGLPSMIAHWNGSAYAPLGVGFELGLNGIGVNRMALLGNDLYATGDFYLAKNVVANSIARWDGNSWSVLGNGLTKAGNIGIGFALAISGNDLYVGGSFDTAGGVSASNIAKWNGSTWSALGSGVNGDVSDLAIKGSDLYVGGSFDVAGGVVARNIARWNGSTWSALDGGVNGGGVGALAVSGNDLYVGGSFTTAGTVTLNIPVSGIAKWNGTAWSALSGGVNPSSVYALAVRGNDLYVGGRFTTAGGVSANGLAKWNGSSWAAFGGSGTNNPFTSFVAGEDALYVVGGFQYAGGRASVSLARYVYDLSLATSVSGASYLGETLAPESIVSVFGQGLATTTQGASALPLPTALGGTLVHVRDSAGIDRPAPLFYVSPEQVNYQIPEGTALGPATVTLASNDGKMAHGTINIGNVAPGLFTAAANGQGPPAAYAVRVKADGMQSTEDVVRFDPALNRFVAVPIDLGPASEQVILVLYGTGFRFINAPATVMCNLGGTQYPVQYAGAQGVYVGLDQANVLLPRNLSGRGDISVNLVVDGKSTNTVTINVR